MKCERIVRTFYDALEEGKIMGRKCTACGHVEFPPYLACNACGNLETQWCEISGKAVCVQMMPPSAAFLEPDFKKNVGDYFVAAVKPEDGDELGTCLVGVDPARFEELQKKIPFPVRPKIIQEDGYKMVFWELDE